MLHLEDRRSRKFFPDVSVSAQVRHERPLEQSVNKLKRSVCIFKSLPEYFDVYFFLILTEKGRDISNKAGRQKIFHTRIMHLNAMSRIE